MERDYNFNKDITFLEKINEWFFDSNIVKDKEVFSYTNSLKVAKKELELAGIIEKHYIVYDEYESLYIDFKDRKDAKIFIKKLNAYIQIANQFLIDTKNIIKNELELISNPIILKRIENFKNLNAF